MRRTKPAAESAHWNDASDGVVAAMASAIMLVFAALGLWGFVYFNSRRPDPSQNVIARMWTA